MCKDALVIFVPTTIAVILPDFMISIVIRIRNQIQDNWAEYERVRIAKGAS